MEIQEPQHRISKSTVNAMRRSQRFFGAYKRNAIKDGSHRSSNRTVITLRETHHSTARKEAPDEQAESASKDEVVISGAPQKPPIIKINRRVK